MIAQKPLWTADVVGKLHLYGITTSALADALCWERTYLSAVLNGRRTPPGAEQKVTAAVQRLIVA